MPLRRHPRCAACGEPVFPTSTDSEPDIGPGTWRHKRCRQGTLTLEGEDPASLLAHPGGGTDGS